MLGKKVYIYEHTRTVFTCKYSSYDEIDDKQ